MGEWRSPQPRNKPFFLFLASFSRSILRSLQAAHKMYLVLISYTILTTYPPPPPPKSTRIFHLNTYFSSQEFVFVFSFLVGTVRMILCSSEPECGHLCLLACLLVFCVHRFRGEIGPATFDKGTYHCFSLILSLSSS